MIISIFIVITLLITAYSLVPLIRPRERWLAAVEYGASRKQLDAEKESYLRAIKDIEFEHASNKINDHDYKQLKKYYGAKAAQCISDIEKFPSDELSSSAYLSEEKLLPICRREELRAKISTVKGEMKILEDSWQKDEIDDDEYFLQTDDYTKEFESLVSQLVKLSTDQNDD